MTSLPDIQPVLADCKCRLQELYGDRLKGLILYGSWARAEATNDSDIDIAVVLDAVPDKPAELDRMLDTVYDLNLHHDTLIAVYPVAQADLDACRDPLSLNLTHEGLAL